MEQLLFAARKLVQSMDTGTDDPEGHHPDLSIPEDWQHIPTLQQYLDIQQVPNKGQGFVAKQNLAAGTLLLVSKPISMVLDSEADEVAAAGQAVEAADDQMMDDDEDDQEEETERQEDEKDPHVNELLLLEVLDQLNSDPSLWEQALSKLYPRTEEEVAQLPAWVCDDDDIFMEMEKGVLELERQHEVLRPVVKEISKRLPLIIRYNILSMETCPELLSYPGAEGFSKLSGVGLYHLPSFFNHSKTPNVARFAIGDVMCFVANQDIPAGAEVCISYIEHDVLCESAYRRNMMLSMNFDDNDDGNSQAIVPNPAEKDGPDMPVVDSDVQNELMTMDPLERLTSIEELLAQATGQKMPEEQLEEEMIEDAPPVPEGEDEAMGASEVTPGWFQCDIQNLRILKAITLEGLGQSDAALKLWEEAIQFVETKLPPLDENGIVLRVQAALTAYLTGNTAAAENHASVALTQHNLLFGGGVALFRIRFGPDLRLPLRPASRTSSQTTNAIDALWPLR
eukprot:CAMPEP_0172453762 /NCGR_PEP_ID=MMETSP1065-20121228/10943_1 /TAXON_ID=265537 /ORGANISM="Amphiprora paludosa, Strain CCMP125" /LENGTH=509 /DNA_ID=CAMNT_0013205969 /DNA_START=124 /DNA_END=1653 /DNA_ORIENTATION=-